MQTTNYLTTKKLFGFRKLRVALTLAMGLVLILTPLAWAGEEVTPAGAPFVSGMSNTAVADIPRTSQDRRLLIVGNYDYEGTDSDLVGPIYDANNMQTTYAAAKYSGAFFTSIVKANNKSVTGIKSAIASAFAGADSSDVSYFYYSGHGSTQGGTAYLIGTDGYGLSSNDLKTELDKIAGTKVIILDSCYSGGFAGSPPSSIAAATVAKSFNAAFIDTFAKDSFGKEISGSSYKIIAASSASQYSWEGSFTGSPDPSNGYFTYYFCKGLGGPPVGNNTLYADANSDNNVSLQEIYNYTYNILSPIVFEDGARQYVQVYPASDTTFNIFSKTEGGGSASYDIRGDWTLTFTWSGQSPNNTGLTFSGNTTSGTFVNDSYTGTYSVNGSSVDFTYNEGAQAHYTGSFSSSDYMSGTMADNTGSPGTWYATRSGGGTNIPVTSVELSSSTASIEAGSGTQLTATVYPSNATNKSVTWDSSDDSVATVSNGWVYGISEGTATISATTVDGGYYDICEVDVTEGGGEVGDPYITVTLKTGEEVADGETLTMTAKQKLQFTTCVYDENGDVVKKPKLKYASSNKKVCTVAKGKLTAGKTAGSATITITDKYTGAIIEFYVEVGGGSTVDVVGTWDYNEVYYDNSGEAYDYQIDMIFKKDGSIELSDYGDGGDYTLSGNTITIRQYGYWESSGDDFVETCIGTVSGSYMSGTLSFDNGYEGTWYATKTSSSTVQDKEDNGQSSRQD